MHFHTSKLGYWKLTKRLSNIDRLFAQYQAQHPDAFLQPSNVGGAGNVFVEDRSEVDGDTPLLPFRRNPGSFWTTNEAMDWKLFGYDYADTKAANAASAQATVARLYSGNARSRVALGNDGGFAHSIKPSSKGTTYTDWVVNVAAAPLDLPPSFVVQFSFVGDFSSDLPMDVGMWAVLMPKDHKKGTRLILAATELENRATDVNMTLHGTVSLMTGLLDQIDASNLQSLDEHDVVPFLKEKLTWKVFSVSLDITPDD